MLLSYKSQDKFEPIEVDEDNVRVGCDIIDAIQDGAIKVIHQSDNRQDSHLVRVKAIRSILHTGLAETSAIVWYYEELEALKKREKEAWEVLVASWQNEVDAYNNLLGEYNG